MDQSMGLCPLQVPISTVIINRLNKEGSRTILHHRGNMPEVNAQEFIDIFPFLGGEEDPYGWVHFEGRNFHQIKLMMEWIRAKQGKNKRLKLSLELEKVRDHPYHQQLLPLPDVLFVSKDFARHKGFLSATEALEGLTPHLGNNQIVICPWGSDGVAGKVVGQGEVTHVPAYTPPNGVVDTLAAGDTLIGAVIHHLHQANMAGGGGSVVHLRHALTKAAEIAGKKCGQRGLLNLQL